MLHDPEVYDEPDAFKPERFLTSEFGTKPGADLAGRRNDLHFGGGRVSVVQTFENLDMP